MRISIRKELNNAHKDNMCNNNCLLYYIYTELLIGDIPLPVYTEIFARK